MPHGPEEVGVGPWPGEPPSGREQYDGRLLAEGDRRNVVDRYRYWTMEAIVADLDTRRHDFHVAIENWQHDFNIGTIVRTANAFLAREVHIVGNRRWNRRGAMVTDRYQHVRHHPDVDDAGRRTCTSRAWSCSASTTCRVGADRDARAAAAGLPAVRPGGTGALGGGAGGLRRHLLDRAVRLDAVDQRLGCCRDRDAHVGPSARRPRRVLAGLVPSPSRPVPADAASLSAADVEDRLGGRDRGAGALQRLGGGGSSRAPRPRRRRSGRSAATNAGSQVTIAWPARTTSFSAASRVKPSPCIWTVSMPRCTSTPGPVSLTTR